MNALTAMLYSSPIATDLSTVWGGSNGVFAQIKDLTDTIIFPVALAILAIMLISDIVKAVIDYRRGDNINIIPIIVLFVGIGMLIALRASGALWALVGLN